MLNLDPGKLLVVAIVAIIVLGPDKLPQFAKQVGGMWRSFGDFRQRMESQVRQSIPDLPSTADITNYARSPGALLNRLSEMSSDSPAEGEVSPVTTTDSPPPTPEPAQPHWTTRDFETPPNPFTDLPPRTAEFPVPVDANLN